MSDPTRALSRLSAAVALTAAAAGQARAASTLLGASPVILACAAAVVPTALAAAALLPARRTSRTWRAATFLLPASALVAPWLAALLLPLGTAGPWLLGLVALAATLPLAARGQVALRSSPPSPLGDALGAALGAGLALAAPPWLALTFAALLGELLARPPRAAHGSTPADSPVRGVALALGGAGVVLTLTWLRGITDPGTGSMLLCLGAAVAAAAVGRGLSPARASLAPVLGAATLLAAWVLVWKGPGLARMSVLQGVSNAGELPAWALRAAPGVLASLLLGALLGTAWGPRPAHRLAWLGAPLGLLLLGWLSTDALHPLWLAGAVGASSLLWSLAPATWVLGLAVAGLSIFVGTRGGGPDLQALVQPAWRLTRSDQAALADAESRAETRVLLASVDPKAGARELRVPSGTWDASLGGFQPGARPQLVLTTEGQVLESGGRLAAAERFAGLLAPLLAPRLDQALILGDDLGLVLSGLLDHPVAAINVATPAPDLLRAVAAADPARQANWLDARVRLLAAHPEAALRAAGGLSMVVEVLRSPWGDAQHASPGPSHLAAVARALPDDGLYLVAVHLDWFEPGQPAALGQALSEHFAHVQAWLPPQGADTLILVGTQAPLPLSRLQERMAADPSLVAAFGQGAAEDLASLAVTDAAGLDAWARAEHAAPWALPLGPGPAATRRPFLHLAGLAGHVAEPDALWQLDDPGQSELLEPRLQARATFLRLLAEATSGDMEAVFSQARKLRETSGSVAAATLEPLIDPHVRDARRAIQRARGEGLNSKGWDEAMRYATTARMLAPTSPRPLVLLGDIALGRGNAQNALEHFGQALELDAEHVPALLGQARAYKALGDSGRAEASLREATRVAPAAWQTWQTLGVFLMTRDQLDEAERCFREAMRLSDGTEVLPQLGLAELLLVDGRYDAARLTADTALQHQETAYGWYLRGRAWFELGELERAEQDLRRAVILDPGLVEARGGIGWALAAQGELEQAAEAFRAVLRQRPDDIAARENLRRIEEELAATAPPSR